MIDISLWKGTNLNEILDLHEIKHSQGIAYNHSVFVFNSKRWRYFQIQQFENKGKKLRIFHWNLGIDL